jgi:putative membrane protein
MTGGGGPQYGAIVNDLRTLVLQVRSFVKKDRATPELQRRGVPADGVVRFGDSARPGTLATLVCPPAHELVTWEPRQQAAGALGLLHTEQTEVCTEQEAINPFQCSSTKSGALLRQGIRAERIKSTLVLPYQPPAVGAFNLSFSLGTLILGLVEINVPVELPILLHVRHNVLFPGRAGLPKHARPFSNLPDTNLVTAIARYPLKSLNLWQLLNEEKCSKQIPAEAFYLINGARMRVVNCEYRPEAN